MDARYILLIQKQFDQPLSERETYELQGFLAGNEAAAKLCENVRRLLEESENVDLPEKFKPVDADYLLTEILAALTQTKSRSWFSFVKQFMQARKSKLQVTSTHQDELAVLRKHRATAENTSKAMDALRAKVVAEVAPVSPEDAVSLAEAIKRRMINAPTPITSETPPTISESMDQLFSSSNWPVVTAETIRDAEQHKQDHEQELKQQEAQPKEDEYEFKPSLGPAPFASVLRTRFQQQQQKLHKVPAQQTEPTTAQHKQAQLTPAQNGQAQLTQAQHTHTQHTDVQLTQAQQEPIQHTQVQSPAAQQHTEANREQSAPGQKLSDQKAESDNWSNAFQDEWTPIQPEQMEPIWQLELEAREPDSAWPPQPAAVQPDPVWPPQPAAVQPDPVWPPQPAAVQPDPIWPPQPAAVQGVPNWSTMQPTLEPERLRPASLIPVDDIIAHVSHMFSEHITDEETKATPNVVPLIEDPLGASSGQYPQIREMDLRKANAARLGATINTDESNGQIKALGNFLLDKQSAATIGNLSNVKANLAHARILSDEEAQALQDCLSPIESLQGVAGCIILGYDGMIITSSLPDHADKDALSAWALLTYMNTHDLVRVVGHNRLRQFVSRTLSGYLLLADFGQGLLLAVSDNASTEAILPLMKSVRRVTAA